MQSKEADDGCNTNQTVKRKSQTSLLTFEQFAKRKSEERSANFKVKKGMELCWGQNWVLSVGASSSVVVA